MDETLRALHRVISITGISVSAKTDNWVFKLQWTTAVFNFIISVFTVIFTFGYLFDNHSNLLLCIQGLPFCLTGLMMSISLGVCLMFRDKFREFLTEVGFKDVMLEMPFIRYVLEEGNGNKLNELKTMVERTQGKLFKFTRVLLKSYVASVWLCVTLFLCGPVYFMFVGQDLRLLAFYMWFPWSLDNFYVYIVSFILHSYMGYLCCIAYPGLNCVIILLVGQIIRQLRILTFILQHLDALVVELYGQRNTKWQLCCTEILSQCVDHYVKLKSFSNRLNAICQPFYLVLLVDTTALVCIYSVQIAICDKLWPDIIKYIAVLLCFIMVVFIFCFIGQQVENECGSLEAAITDKWYLFNQTHKVHVLLFKMALSQGMPIYIFGRIPLSLPIFTKFMKTGMSFFTLVMSVLEE